jgi:hypothetical protein
MNIVACKTFNDMFYQWCIDKMTREVDTNFKLLNEMRNPYSCLAIYVLRKFSQQEQKDILTSEIQRFLSYLRLDHAEKDTFIGEEITSFNQMMSSLKSSDPHAKSFFSDSALNFYQHHSKSFLAEVIRVKMGKGLYSKSKKYGDTIRFSKEQLHWCIITDIELNKGYYSYAHQIEGAISGQKVRLIDYTIYFPRCIGLLHGETWCFRSYEDIEISAEIISGLCKDFLDFLANNLPDLSECEIIAH